MWFIRYDDRVIKHDIPRLNTTIKQRIKRAIDIKLASDPIRFGKPLRHSLHNHRSLRAGDYRILYHLDHDKTLVSIVHIGHRREVYQ